MRSPSFSATISVHAFQSHGIEGRQLAQLLHRGSTPGANFVQITYFRWISMPANGRIAGTSDATRPSASQSDIVAGTIRNSGEAPSSYTSNHQPGCTRPGCVSRLWRAYRIAPGKYLFLHQCTIAGSDMSCFPEDHAAPT
jgi:hypothetical protein